MNQLVSAAALIAGFCSFTGYAQEPEQRQAEERVDPRMPGTEPHILFELAGCQEAKSAVHDYGVAIVHFASDYSPTSPDDLYERVVSSAAYCSIGDQIQPFFHGDCLLGNTCNSLNGD